MLKLWERVKHLEEAFEDSIKLNAAKIESNPGYCAVSRTREIGKQWGPWEMCGYNRSLKRLKASLTQFGIPKGYQCQLRFLKVSVVR